MRIIRYLKMTPLAVVLIAVLLLVQALAELALPRFTSEIVDVGIQQSGLEHVAIDEMTAETFKESCAALSADDAAFLCASYDQIENGNFRINDQGLEKRERLDEILTGPMVMSVLQDSGLAAQEANPEATSSALQEFDQNSDVARKQTALMGAQQAFSEAGGDLASLQLTYLLRVGGLMLALAALGMVASIAIGYLASRAAAKIAQTLRLRLFEQVVSFSDSEINQFSAASLITRGTNDIQQIQMVVVILLRMVLYAPILAVGGIFMVSTTNMSLTWVIVLAVVCLFVVIGILMSVALPQFKKMQKLVDRVNLVAREILTGLPVIRAFDRQAFEEARFDTANTNLMRTQLFTNRVMTFMMPLMMLIMNGVSVLIVWVGASSVDSGAIQTGDMIAFITYSMVIIMSFLIIGMVSIMLPRANVAAERVDAVLSAQPSITDPATPRDAELSYDKGVEVAFHKVTFSYTSTKDGQPALCDIDFAVEPGTTCAFIGSTGSGKSTIAKLLLRFYDPTQGFITLNGIDIRELSQTALHRSIGYVPQKTFLFSGTIASNVGYSNEDLSRKKLNQAVEFAQAKEFIEAKEEGMESPISQGGTNVSGGQRQRLAIARALASEAPILLFDDSFSALDYQTDARLRRDLTENLGHRSLLMVAQRVSTIMDADQIIVLEDGHMVGKGTHRELLDNCETYREIAYSQLSEEELRGGDCS